MESATAWRGWASWWDGSWTSTARQLVAVVKRKRFASVLPVAKAT